MNYLKSIFGLSAIAVIFAQIPVAKANPGDLLYSCGEATRLQSYQLWITDGPHSAKVDYNSFLELKTYDYQNQPSVISAQASGTATRECASRAVPCVMMTTVQYETQNPAMIFTLTEKDGANFMNADLSIYGNGFGKASTQFLPMNCSVSPKFFD